MASMIEHVTTELRRRILSGALAPGERVLEVQFSAELGVSRTPLRLALGELEKEGLLERVASRGFRVRLVTMEQITMAIDVRGTLEGMAARLAAEAGVPSATLDKLKACLQEGRAVVAAALVAGRSLDTMRWAGMNALFHQTLVQSACNPVLASALDHVTKMPMAGPGALGTSGQPVLELSFVQRAQLDHEDIVQAIEAREGGRAEALLREHARRSRDNKRALLEAGHTPLRPAAAALQTVAAGTRH